LSDSAAPPAPLPRYALYYAPRPEDGLAATASQWLGRNPETGQARAPRPVPGLPFERLAHIVAEPRLYGFHGTLKAPIALAEDRSEREFVEAVGGFAARERAFAVPALELAELSGFLALVPAARCPDLQDLADRCVMEFDEFRRPAGEAELARRRSSGLTPRQDALLARWGYPYVFDEWRFHLTLTGRLSCARERETVTTALRQRFAAVVERPLPVNDLCIFRQPAPGRPFTVLARFRLGGGRRVRTEAWQGP
jgi:putative phosphonate metabolism protein